MAEERFKPVTTHWSTLSSRNVERFSAAFDAHTEAFDRDWLERLSERARSANSLSYKILLAYSIILVATYISQTNAELELEFFGFGAKGVGKLKEYLVIIASSLGVAHSVLFMHAEHLVRLLKKHLEKSAPSEIAEFLAYGYIFEPFASLDKKGLTESQQHTYTKILSLILVTTVAILAISAIGGMMFMQVAVIIDIIKNPSTPNGVSWFTVIYAVTAFLFSATLALLKANLPTKDYSNFYKLEEMKETDPKRYTEIWNSILVSSERAQLRYTAVAAAIIFALTYSTASLWSAGTVISSSNLHLAAGIAGAIINYFISPRIVLKARKFIGFRFIQKHPEGTPNRLDKFKRMDRARSALYLAIPGLIAFGLTSLFMQISRIL